jgi:LAO/AO transport system kinase
MQANELFDKVQSGDRKSLARAISVVENELSGYEEILQLLPSSPARIIGITGPPGAGKSTLVDGLIGLLRAENKKIAVLCVDPSSAFNKGAILGDRIRMNEWFTDSNVYIRSLGTRGSLGGLHPKIIEITDLLKAAGFDQIIIETVGVGQSEIEIAGLADATVVVLVPESGDEVQTMKAGLMEIADIFVVNKSDRPQADVYLKYLQQMLAPTFSKHYQEVPVIKTVATTKEGLQELYRLLMHQLQKAHVNDKTFWLLAERAFYLIGQKRMKGIEKSILKKEIEAAFQKGNFNLYKYIADK